MVIARRSHALFALIVVAGAAVACSEDDGNSAPVGGAPVGGAQADMGTTPSAPCVLRDDPSAPGQYSDSCVDRAWVEPYAGRYTSDACALTIAVDGDVPANFTLEVLSGDLAGSYTNAWQGGTALGNDSYFRFTTDATFATTQSLYFNAGQALDNNGERSIGFRVSDIATGTPTYSGSFSLLVGGAPQDVDCGALTRAE
jgi:hypothetical protein